MTTTAYQSRQKLLSLADEVIDAYANLALGKGDKYKGDAQALGNLFNKIVPLVKIEDDRTQVAGFKEGLTTEQRIEGVFTSVADGKLSLSDGLMALDMLTAGSNIQEAQELRDALKRLG